MLEFPVDCFVGEIYSIRKICSKTFEVMLLLANNYGNNSQYTISSENLSLARATLKISEITLLIKVLNNLYKYYENEFDFQPETNLVEKITNDQFFSEFQDIKLIKDGINVESDGEVGKAIHSHYGDIKFAGLIFMNSSFYKCIESSTFNKINMCKKIRNSLGSQNTFNLLIPVGNLHKNLKIMNTAINIST
jgi:hypothetical protein